MRWIACLGLLAACGGGSADLQERVARLETGLAAQQELNDMLVGALASTGEKLELFLRAVEAGGVELPERGPIGREDAGGEPPGLLDAGTVEAADSGTDEPVAAAGLERWAAWAALLLAVLAWLSNLRLRGALAAAQRRAVVPEGSVPVPGGPPHARPGTGGAGGEPGARGARVSWGDAEVSAGAGPARWSEALGDLSVEGVGGDEVEPAIVPVELDEPPARDRPPRAVQWRMGCADPAAGERLIGELLAADARVLKAPAPVVEIHGDGLRVAYHLHPALTVADRTQIASSLIDVLRAVPPPAGQQAGPRG